MRVTRVLALVLIAVSALSFGLTIYNILTTQWNVGYEFFDMGWRNGNWWEGTGSFDPFYTERYNWFFGDYSRTNVVDVNHSLWDTLENAWTTSNYIPFPSALFGLYLLVCGVVFWFVKEEKQRPSWFYNRDLGNNKFVAGALTLMGGGVSLLCSSIVLLAKAMACNDFRLAIYFDWVFPLAFLGIVFLSLGIVALGFVIIENRRLFQEENPRLFQGYDDYLNHNYRKVILVWTASAFIGFGIISNLIDNYGVLYNLVQGIFISLFSGGCLYLYFRLKDLHNKERPEVSA
jgi:hypothetical protein